MNNLKRRETVTVNIANVQMGSNHPVLVQSMTNTNTEDVDATVTQIVELVNAGSELVRITVNTVEAGRQVKHIKQRLLDLGISVPLIGDFHFNGHKILKEATHCAQSLDKYRINPGNVGYGTKKDQQFAYMIQTAIDNNKVIRIGVNWGSLDPLLIANMMDANAKLVQPMPANMVMHQALIKSALDSANQAMELGLAENKIVISCKVSAATDLITIYQNLAAQCRFPLHLGLTEAGLGIKGIVASTAGMSYLLYQGIGDTIRVSLTPKADESRTQEVKVAQEILQALGIRSFVAVVTSCPGCGRTSSSYFQDLASDIQNYLNIQTPIWCKIYSGVEHMKIAVMGCVVNGPGESKLANIGISLPGRNEAPVAPVFIDGQRSITLKGESIAAEFKQIIANYVEQKYSKIEINNS